MLKPTAKSENPYMEKFVPASTDQFRGDIPFAEIFSASSETEFTIKERPRDHNESDNGDERESSSKQRDDIILADIQEERKLEDRASDKRLRDSKTDQQEKLNSAEHKQAKSNTATSGREVSSEYEKNKEGREIAGFRKLASTEQQQEQKKTSADNQKTKAEESSAQAKNEQKNIQTDLLAKLEKTPTASGTLNKVDKVLNMMTPVNANSESISQSMSSLLSSENTEKLLQADKQNTKVNADLQQKLVSEENSKEGITNKGSGKFIELDDPEISTLREKFERILAGKNQRETTKENIIQKLNNLSSSIKSENTNTKEESGILSAMMDKNSEAKLLEGKLPGAPSIAQMPFEGSEGKLGVDLSLKDKITELKIKSVSTFSQNHSSGSDFSSNSQKGNITFSNQFQGFGDTVKSSSYTELANKILKIVTMYKNSTPVQTMFKVDGGEFGKMDIKFDSVENGTKITISVEQESQQQALQKALSNIKELLDSKGLDFVSIETQLKEDEKSFTQQGKNKNGLPKLNQAEINELLDFDESVPANKSRDFGYNTMEITI